jgi:ribosome-associated protein
MPFSLDDLQNLVINALEDIKGQNILVFDAQPLTSMFDRVILVSGTSNRQTRALAKHLHDQVKKAGGNVYGAEGEETGEWVLVDLGDIIVHIMQPAIRDYYRLEEIWGKHPIDWHAQRKAALEKSTPRRKPTAKKPLNKSDSKRPASASKTLTKPPAVKKTAPKKTGAKKPASKKPKK